MPTKRYTRVVLNERPVRSITPTTFRTDVVPFDFHPGEGDVLVQVNWLSLDPAMRGWISDLRSYIPPVPVGEVMRGHGIATVAQVGSGTKLQTGDVVACWSGWTEYAILKEETVEKLHIPPGAQLLDYLSILSVTGGITAYFGLVDVAKIKAGETLVVSGAAGSVGSLACQLGKIYGAKVIGIAGTDEKCKWLREELKVDAAINYRSPTFKQDFEDAILDLALTRLKKGARVTLCGTISQYNTPDTKGITFYTNLVLQRAKMEGYVVLDYKDRFPEAVRELSKFIAEGRLVSKFHILKGLEKASEGLPMLFDGSNTGKLVVQVSGPDAQL
ncbi:hypothetical protein F5148DRAFT_1280152 [Russula earlei]|uniref:Uncharacterized protein n=1 Tax=Russula earlei TaxID=71964 RepID=A0ACC0UKS8_9AGAM|nr:hypothetical protein F5148DRAFT_1280152 [Russula earlei]